MALPKNFYESWFATGAPGLLDAIKRPAGVSSVPMPPRPVAPSAPALSNNTYDIAGLFQQGTGRPITLPELQDIRGQVAGLIDPNANPALVVSDIQKAIRNMPKTANTPADQFNANKGIVEQYRQQQDAAKAAAPPAPTPPAPAAGIPSALPNFADIIADTPVAPAAPKFQTSLSEAERQQLEAEQNRQIEAERARSEQRIADIQRQGEMEKAKGRRFLAGIGALGRTISGAPEGTGLGELDVIGQRIQRAVDEERVNLDRRITEIQTQGRVKAQERVDQLNKLVQQDFTNRMALAQEGRLNRADQRQLAKDLFEVAKDVPRGQAIQFGDHYVTGIKEVTPEVDEYSVYDANSGILAFGGVNKATGEPIYEYKLQVGDPKEIENWRSVVVDDSSLWSFNEKTGEWKDSGITVPKQYKPTTPRQYKPTTTVPSPTSPTEISPFAKALLQNPKMYYRITPTEATKVAKELANAGIDIGPLEEGKKGKLMATQQDDLIQAQIARAGVIKLKSMLDKLHATGPVIGRARQLNPYDPQVVAITAEITRIVPGLARGVFKEVGVLTDTDIDRYMRTLANPTATKEQIEALHRDTLDKIDTSLRIITKTYKDLNLDLGTFMPPGETSAQSGTTSSGIKYTIE